MNPWPRNDYFKHADAAGASKETTDAAWRQATTVQYLGLPAVLSLGHLAAETGVAYQHLRAIVCRRIDPYRSFHIRKRAGGYRVIAVADTELAKVQKWIDRFVVARLPVHHAAAAYSHGRSILACAQQHAGCRWLVKVDVQQFFESISEIQVYRRFVAAGYQKLPSLEMARLCTRTVVSTGRMSRAAWRVHPGGYKIEAYTARQLGHLPQGAATSPRLSNAVMLPFDKKVETLAQDFDLVYTRYADDLMFSAHHSKFGRDTAQKLIGEVYRRLRAVGLRPHTAKTVVVPPGARKVVLGLVVNDATPRLSSEFKQRLSCHVHYVRRFGLIGHAQRRGFDSALGFREHLKGLLNFGRQVDPGFIGRMESELGRSDWLSL